MSATVVRLHAPVADADRDAVLALEAVTEPRPLGWTALGAEAAGPDGCLVVLREGDAVVRGFASGRLLAGTVHVLRLAVDPASRRRGHGRALLAALLAWAVEVAADEVTLEVRAGNVAARALYGAAGFAEVGRRPRYYPDGEDAVLMTRAVG